MRKRMLSLMFSSLLAFSLSTPILAQETQAKPEKEQVKKKDRWDGIVKLNSKNKSMLIVRQQGTVIERTVTYDAMTRWTSQAHGSKKSNDIDASQVQEGDRVICQGTLGKGGVLHATSISKRLTPQ